MLLVVLVFLLLLCFGSLVFWRVRGFEFFFIFGLGFVLIISRCVVDLFIGRRYSEVFVEGEEMVFSGV